MRLAFSVAPNEAKKIIRKIDDDDKNFETFKNFRKVN